MNKAAFLRQIEQQSGRCAYCHRPISLDADTPDNLATRDHFWPKALGGTDRPDNIVAACLPCNARKGSMTPSEFTRRLGGQPDDA